jgi:heavy metal translocating P-type ATPase
VITRWREPLASLAVLLGGLALQAGPLAVWGTRLWSAGLLVLGLPVVWRTVRGLAAGRFAADVVASLAILAALALGQPVAGLVVVLMQTGGEALDQYAARRASRAVAALEAAAPRQAHRRSGDGWEDIAADQVRRGDVLLARPGELIPCDGVVREGRSHLDVSRLTGEPIPELAEPGTVLRSGSINLDGPLVFESTAPAAESQYARIVQLVRSAEASKAPLQRMADRYAVLFTPITLLVCLVTWWLAHDPLRVLAVLVVATPCPLILAAPVAMIGGINRAARAGVIVRHGEALERMSSATAVLLDKTGTITVGRPLVTEVRPLPPFDEAALLALVASVEQGSGHMLAQSVVLAAEERGLELQPADSVRELPGQGVAGCVAGHDVAIGSRAYLLARYPGIELADGRAPGLRAWVAVDGRAAGTMDFADQLRPEAPRLVARLRELGFRHLVLVTGDHAGHANAMARAAGIPEVRAELLPEDKVAAVAELEAQGEKVLMLGDGTNDAPALARASVGVALAAHGGGITAETADVVVLADDPSRVADAVAIGRRTLRIARQSIAVGLGLSALGMAIAALGYIPPTIGAVLQEVIDLAVILNALRASAD